MIRRRCAANVCVVGGTQLRGATMSKVFRFISVIFTVLLTAAIPSSVLGAQETPEITTVSLYLVDITNSMMGCNNCLLDGPTDKVLPMVVERIAGEVKAAPRPLEVYVIPFAHDVIDFDGDGAFDPWRKFVIGSDQDAKDFAEYLNPKKYGTLNPGDTQHSSKLLPVFGGSKSKIIAWPGFEEMCADRPYINTALYSVMNQAIGFLREMTPDMDKNKAWRKYILTHTHRITVFTDSLNTMKTANFAHVVQGAGVHRDEMDGQFWISKVYVEGAKLDAKVSDSILEEEKINGDSENILLYRFRELPDVEDLIGLDSYSVVFDEGLNDPAKYENGEMTLTFPGLTVTGKAEKLTADIYPSSIDTWPKESGLKLEGAVCEKPFDNIGEAFSPKLYGIMNILKKGLTQADAKMKITAEAKDGNSKPMFLMTGAPEVFIHADIRLDPPTSTVTASIVAPGGPESVAAGEGAWTLKSAPLRKIRDGLPGGSATLTGDKYLLPGSRVKVIFDENLLSVVTEKGRSLTSGELAELGAFSLTIKAPPSPGKISADLEFVFPDTHLIFKGGASSYKARFEMDVKSDMPFYLAVGGGIGAFFIVLIFVIIKFLVTPPKISTLGGRLVLIRRKDEALEEERDLGQIHKNRFVVGKGPQCDWTVADDTAPHYAFVIELRKKENRLRLRKWDSEVEEIKINNNDLSEAFLKEGDHIEISNHEFVFHK